MSPMPRLRSSPLKPRLQLSPTPHPKGSFREISARIPRTARAPPGGYVILVRRLFFPSVFPFSVNNRFTGMFPCSQVSAPVPLPMSLLRLGQVFFVALTLVPPRVSRLERFPFQQGGALLTHSNVSPDPPVCTQSQTLSSSLTYVQSFTYNSDAVTVYRSQGSSYCLVLSNHLPGDVCASASDCIAGGGSCSSGKCVCIGDTRPVAGSHGIQCLSAATGE